MDANHQDESVVVSRAMLDSVLSRLDALERQVVVQQELLSRRVVQADDGLTDSSADTPAAASGAAGVVARGRATRRAAIKRTAAVLAALGLTGAAGTRRAGAQTPPGTKAAGNTGDPFLVGALRTGGTSTELTGIQNSINGPTNILFVASQDVSFVNITGNLDTTKYNVALLGQSVLDGVNGKQSVGVYGQSIHGTGVVADGLWPLRINPSAAGAGLPDQDNAVGANPAPSGVMFYQRGAFHASGAGNGTFDPDTIWFNFATPTQFSVAGATFWRRIASQASAGVFVPITPVRVLNTGFAVATPIGFDGTGAALTTNFQLNVAPNTDETRQFRLAGQFGLPSDIRGVLGNVTLIQSAASGGFVSIFAGGAPAPTVSTVNPSTPIQANSFFSQIGQAGAGAGNISVRAVGDQAKNIILDIFGYYF